MILIIKIKLPNFGDIKSIGMNEIKLFDCLPTRMIDVNNLMLGWRAFTRVYFKKGTLLYNIKYTGYKPFSIEYRAPQDGFYVHNGSCLDHAKWFDWGHTDKEPILCEFWDSKEEFENSRIIPDINLSS